MKRTAGAVLAALIAAISLSLTAVPAQGDGYTTVTVTISDVVVVGGTDIHIDAEAKTAGGNPVNCAWTITLNGASAAFVNGPNPDTASGSSFHKVYSTDRVNQEKDGSATATCTYESKTLPATLGHIGHFTGGIGRFSTSLPTVLQTASRTGIVDLLPRGGGSDSDSDSDGHHHKHHKHHGKLPNTGGERLLWLLIGLALVAGGTTVVVSSRKRDDASV